MTGHMLVNGVRIKLATDYDDMCNQAAQKIVDRIASRTQLNILVPTGITPAGVYRRLRVQKPAFFERVAFFNMDEYCTATGSGFEMIPEADPASYRRYMQEHLFNDITPAASFFPGIENVKNPGHYDRLIESANGIDLCLNAVGEDGHTFGFNLPGSAFDSTTRLVRLSAGARKVNKGLTGLVTPVYAVTVGLGTGMAAKEVIFLVSGKRKAAILKRILSAKEPTTALPATILKRHPRCHWIVDADATQDLC